MLLTLAWRNIWRTPRRTLTIMTAVVIGLWAMVLAGALMRGMMASMLDNSLQALVGHIQIHQRGFQDDPVVENRMTDTSVVTDLLRHRLGDTCPGRQSPCWSLRVRVPAVAANARHSGGVSMVGVQVEREAGLSVYGTAGIEGSWLEPGDDRGIVIGRALARAMGTRVGGKVVLMSQGADHDMASRAFRIRGVFHAELESTEKQFVFVSLAASQAMLRIGSGVTEAAIGLPSDRDPGELASVVRAALPGDYEVLTWRDMLPVLQGYVGMFDLFLYIWYVVIFLAMAFGIVNTLLMAVMERIREFGLLKALGQSPGSIVGGIVLESAMILALGAVLGTTLGVLSIWSLADGIDMSVLARGSEFLGMSRIIRPAPMLHDIVGANAVVIVLGVLVCLYPAFKAGRITPVKALAHT